MVPLEVERNGRGIGDHLRAIHQHGHLPLAGETEQLELADAGGDLHHGEVEAFGGKHQPHLLAEGGMPELVQLHASNPASGRQSSQHAAGTDHPGR